MRGSILLCLSAFIASAFSTGYVPGTQYVYNYYANIFSELEDQHHQHAGFVFKTKVYVQPVDGAYFIKLDDFAYDKINTRVTGLESYNFEYHENKEVEEWLNKPFKVYFEHGLVTRMKLARDEPEYSLNIKKGVASLFQLNFDQVHLIKDSNDEKHVTEPRSKYFKVMEPSLMGECEVVYEIAEDHESSQPLFNVTKSRNYHNCVTQAYQFYHSAHYEQCATGNLLNNPIQMSDVYHYEIRGDRHNYLIERIDSEYEFYYMPYTINGDKPYTHVNRTLVFSHEKTDGVEIALPADIKSHQGLEYELEHRFDFHEVVDLKKPHYLYDILHEVAHIEELGKLFLNLLESDDGPTHTDYYKGKYRPLYFAEFVNGFSAASYDDINNFYEQYVDKKEDEKYSKYLSLFADVLSATGTNPTLLFGKYLIQKKVLPSHLVEHFLASWPETVKETHEVLLEKLYRICERDIAKNYPKLKSNCYLAFSSVIYENCVSNYYDQTLHFPSNAKSICTPEYAEKYFEYLVHDYSEQSDNYGRLTNIKVAGNFGIKKTYKYMKELIEHDSYPTYFRTSAVWGLRRVADRFPGEVRKILVPVYMNRSEPHELRVAAFTMILQSGPALFELEALVQDLHDEPSQQVISYVYSSLYHLEHSDYPCYREIKKDIQVVMRHLERLHLELFFDFRHSYAFYDSGYNEQYDLGGATQFSYVTSNNSYFPTSIYLGLKDYFSGKHFNTFSVSYHGSGLDKFFDKIFAPEGLHEKKHSFFDMFKSRPARDTSKASVEKELKEIDQQLHIKPREYEHAQGDITFRLFGNDIAFFHFDEDLFNQFFEGDAKFNHPEISALSSKRFLLVRNSYLSMPMEVGLPVYLDYKEPIYYNVKHVQTTFDIKPSLLAEERSADSPSSLELGVDAQVVYDHVIIASHGVVIPFEHVEIGVARYKRTYFSAPLKFHFNYDLKTHKFNLKLAPTIDHTIFHQSSHPFTYIDYYNNEVPIIKEKNLIPYYKPEEYKQAKYNFFHDYFGYGLHLDFQFGKLHHLKNLGSYKKFTEENDFRTRFQYYSMDPHVTSYDFDAKITPAKDEVPNNIELSVNFDYHGPGTRDNKPYRSDLYNHDDDIENHIKEFPGRKFYTYVIKAELKAMGGKEKRAVAEITHTHSCDHEYHAFNLYYDRTPFTAEETEHFQVCMTANTRWPQYDIKKLYDLDTLELNQELKSSLILNFGKDCKTDHKVTIRAIKKRSQEQIDLEHKREEVDHLHYNPFSYYYHKCQEDHKLGQHYSPSCRKYILYATSYHHHIYDIEIPVKDVTPEFRNAVEAFFDHIDHSLHFYETKTRIYDKEVDHSKAQVELIHSVAKGELDLHVLRPRVKSHYYGVPTPFYLRPHSGSPYLSFSNWERLNQVYRLPFCTVEGEIIKTFDNVTYPMPDTDCYKVISKDCSEKEYFTILGKKITHNRFAKAVKVFLGKIKVEALPVTEDSDIIIRVNGKKVPVTVTEPYFYYVGEKDQEVEIFHVIYNGLYYTIYSEYYGVTVYYDGKAIITELEPYYRGKHCGLCGDFNNDAHHEFRGPDHCVYTNPIDFGFSYALDEDTCTVPEFKNPCEHEATQPCTVMRNRYVYVGTKQRQMCFTTIPLPECSKDCVESPNKVTRNIGFHCLSAKEYFTRFLQRESRNRVLHEVKGKIENHFEEVVYPQECVPATH